LRNIRALFIETAWLAGSCDLVVVVSSGVVVVVVPEPLSVGAGVSLGSTVAGGSRSWRLGTSMCGSGEADFSFALAARVYFAFLLFFLVPLELLEAGCQNASHPPAGVGTSSTQVESWRFERW
jgi:hypothetical protein